MMKPQSKCRIILREDINWVEGKLAVQVGHASDSIWMDFTVCCTEIRGYNAVKKPIPSEIDKKVDDFTTWMNEGRRKIVLRTKDEQSMHKLFDKVKKAGYHVRYIYDYAFNHFDEMTCTGFVVYPTRDTIQSLKRTRLW